LPVLTDLVLFAASTLPSYRG